jgi:hypothetical protein
MTFEYVRAFVVIATIVAALLVIMTCNGGADPRRKLVFDNLDAALEGGQFEPGNCLDGMSPDEIAYDMTMYAEGCENYRPEDLALYVHEWQRERG